MAEIKIRIRISHSGGDDLLLDGLGDERDDGDTDLDGEQGEIGSELMATLLKDDGWKLGIRKSVKPCPVCAVNNDPYRVKLHDGCQCEVVLKRA